MPERSSWTELIPPFNTQILGLCWVAGPWALQNWWFSFSMTGILTTIVIVSVAGAAVAHLKTQDSASPAHFGEVSSRIIVMIMVITAGYMCYVVSVQEPSSLNALLYPLITYALSECALLFLEWTNFDSAVRRTPGR